MSSPEIYLVRHGETEWSKSGQHTGLTDIPLTPEGETGARALGKRISEIKFDHLFSSPLKRAHDTCKLCGHGDAAIITDALLEWNYGDYEGVKSVDIHKDNPGWNIFKDGAPNGESVKQVADRCNAFLEMIEKLEGRVALFSSGHILRALTTRWLGLPMEAGRLFILSTGSLSIYGYEHGKHALRLWNETV